MNSTADFCIMHVKSDSFGNAILRDSRLQICATAAFVFLLAGFARAQHWQFLFDPNGNLLLQTTEVIAPPQILAHPQNRIIGPDEVATFSVVVVDTRLLAYQWRFNGTNISGATNDAVLLQNVSTNNEGEYRVVLTNPSGSVTSAPAMLWIDSDADGVPDFWERLYFTNLSQNATADFDRDGVANLTEFFEGTNPTNRLSARFRLTLFTDGDGVVELSPNQVSYTNGETVTLTATPFGTNLFYGWTGDIRTNSNPLVVTMMTNKTIRAHFHFLPLDIVWTNLAGGSWHSPANWNPNLVPGALDNAIIPISATITVSNSAECLGLTLGSASGSPTLTGSGTLTIYENFLWTLGTMSGTGRTILETNGTLNIGAFVTLNARTLENRGTALVFNEGGLAVVGGAVVTNCVGALFHFNNESASLGGGSANGRFDNPGTFRKSSGTGTLTMNPGMNFNNFGAVDIEIGTFLCSGSFSNSGTVNIAAGATHRLAAGGAATGSFTTPPGALVEWTAGTFSLNAGAQLDGTGLYRIGGTPTVIANANLAVANLHLVAGSLSGTGTITIGNAMNWTGGSMSGSGRTIIPAGVTLNLTIPGAALLTTRTLENDGTILFTGPGTFGVTGSGVVTNRAGALFRVENESISGLGGASANGRFDNLGTFRKSAGTGTTLVSSGLTLNNSGAVEIQSGTLSLSGGGTHSGSFNVPAETALVLSGGTHNGGTFSSMTGDGRFNVSGGTANLAGLVNVSGTNTFSGGVANLTGNYSCMNTLVVSGGTANFNGTGNISPSVILLSSGTLAGSNAVTVGNAMNWTGGSMSGGGRTIIAAGATLNAAPPSSASLNNRILENGGNVIFSGAGILGVIGNSAISNLAGALFRVENESTGGLGGASANGRFDNSGTFRKSAGSGTTLLASGLTFNNSGTVDIRSGILAANGGFNSTANALLNCALGGTTPGTGHGQFQKSGAITLNGALSVDFINGFLPTTNDSFTVLTAGTRNGAFGNFFYPSNTVMMQMSNTPSSVIVHVGGLVAPALVLFPPVLTTSNVLVCWTAESNKTYRLEYAPDPALTNWDAVPGDVTTISNKACKVDALTSSNRFYRVRVLP